MRLLAVLATAGALIGSQAQAGPLFDAFRGACVATAGTLEGVETQAKTAGWMPMPDAMLEQASRRFNPKAARGWLKTDQQALTMLLWAKAEIPNARQLGDMRMCAVASMPGDATAAADMQTWAAVPARPEFKMKDGAAYVFRDEATGRVALPEKASEKESRDFFSTPGATLAMTQTQAQMTMLALFTPDK